MAYTEFDPWGTNARPDEIRHSAERLQSISGVLLGHGDAVASVLSQVALSFSDVVAPVIAAQIGTNLAALETAVQGTQYGYAVGVSWAEDVAAFISARATLIGEWEVAELTDFGVPPPAGLSNADPEMADQMYVNRRLAVDAARSDALRSFEYRGLQLWEQFQLQVEEKGRMFREGPTAANLARLVSNLGWGAMTLWPGSAMTPVHGGTDGADAAATVLRGLDGQTGPQAVADALATIAMITTRAANGHELTAEELAYLEAFYATLGIRVLDVPSHLRSSTGPLMYDADVPPAYVPTIPFDGSPQLVQALTIATANGLLVLSRPTARTDDDDHDGYERSPEWLRGALAIDDIGPTADPYPNFEHLVQLGDLLSYSTVEAGTGLTRELADSVGWMIDYVQYREDSLSPESEDNMQAQVAASAPHLLDVVARNDEVCFDLVTGSGMRAGYSSTDYFLDLYSFDWAVDDGAAAASLTDFIPAWATSGDPVAAARAGAAMFDLVEIVTGDEGFERLMDGVGRSEVAAESAVGQVNPAITQGFVAAMAPFMDQFAGPELQLADPRGLADLSFETRVRFTTLNGTDPVAAVALAGAAHAYEEQRLYEYAVSGDTEQAGGDVGRIRGIVDAGLINAQVDAGMDRADAEAAAARTRQMGIDIAQGLLGGFPAPGWSSFIDMIFAGVNAATGESEVGSLDVNAAGRTEDERRYDTASSVFSAGVSIGQIPASAAPVPFIGPTQSRISVEALTDELVHIAAAYGCDLNAILTRTDLAYGDPDLQDVRGA